MQSYFLMNKNLLYYSIPILMIVIAIFQLFQVPNGLTRWKGGGFGMYSEMHPDYRKVVINDSLITFDTLKNNRIKRIAIKKYAFYPNEKYLKNMIEVIDFNSDTLKVEVWQLDFNSKTRQLKNIKIKEDVVIKN